MRGVEQIPWAYDAFMTLVEAGGFGRWRRWLAAGARGRILDVGTGTGRNLPLFPDSAEVVALEPDLRMLAKARQRASGARLVVGDVQAIPFADASFDTAVSGVVFCSVSEPLRGLAEVHRVLRAEGELRMMEHVRHDHPWLGRLQDWIQPAWTVIAGGCHPNRDTEATVKTAGFEIVASTRRTDGVMRRFVARPVASAAPRASP
jgi:ubiquinone/menaquinone biosynthesis C-methylase UbiE